MSAALPSVDSIILCELVRPDLANKLNILGFYGVLPRAHIRVAEWGHPMAVMFLVNTHGSTKDFKLSLQISNPDGSKFIDSEEVGVKAQPEIEETNEAVVFQIVTTFSQQGRHTVKVFIDGTSALETSFQVGAGYLNIPPIGQKNKF